jgi:hypothetical protein
MTLLPMSVNKLRRHLGYGMATPSILSSVAFVTCLFFYLYVLGSFLEIPFYPLQDRVTFYGVFQEHVISKYLDKVVIVAGAAVWFLVSIKKRTIGYSLSIVYGASGIILGAINPDGLFFDIHILLSLPFIISVVLYHYKHQQKRNVLNFSANLTLSYISIGIIAISAISIVLSVLSIFLTPYVDVSNIKNVSNELFYLLSSFSKVYIFLLILCLPVKVLFKGLLRILKLNLKENIDQRTSANDPDHNSPSTRLNTHTTIGLLLLAMILSIILVLIPQHPSINPDNQNIGVDTWYYVTWVGELDRSKNLSEFAYQAFIDQGMNGDRPLSLIFLFMVYQAVGGNLFEVIEHSPIILGPGIVLAFYFLTLELTRNEKIALIAAFLGGISFHTLGGIYAGFYANWLALIVGYISLVFLFRYLRFGCLSDIVIFSTLLIGVLFFHVYTWIILAAVAGIFLLTMLVVQNKRIKKKDSNYNNNNNNSNNYFNHKRIIWLLLFAILMSIIVYFAKAFLISSSGGLEQNIEVAERGLGIEQFNLRWEILTTTMHHSLGGVFSNFIILILGLFWVLKSNLREPSNVFLMIFFSAGLIPLFFGSWVIQARVFYDMPIEIPTAIALYYISKRSGSILVPFAGCTWLAAVSLLTVTNYYLIPPTGIQ